MGNTECVLKKTYLSCCEKSSLVSSSSHDSSHRCLVVSPLLAASVSSTGQSVCGSGTSQSVSRTVSHLGRQVGVSTDLRLGSPQTRRPPRARWRTFAWCPLACLPRWRGRACRPFVVGRRPLWGVSFVIFCERGGGEKARGEFSEEWTGDLGRAGRSVGGREEVVVVACDGQMVWRAATGSFQGCLLQTGSKLLMASSGSSFCRSLLWLALRGVAGGCWTCPRLQGGLQGSRAPAVGT